MIFGDLMVSQLGPWKVSAGKVTKRRVVAVAYHPTPFWLPATN